MCASQPDGDTVFLANELGVTGSTLRNLLSSSYLRLGVRTRAAAIAKAHQLGILPVEPEHGLQVGNATAPQSGRRSQRKPKRAGSSGAGLMCRCVG